MKYYWMIIAIFVIGQSAIANESKHRSFPKITDVRHFECTPSELQNLSYAIYPDDPQYNTVRLIFNKRFTYFPKAIITPRTFKQAQYVVRIFKKYHLPFSVRSGGHCHEPGSLSSDYVLDLQKFNDIILDEEQGEVYIGAGALLGNVIQKLGEIGYAIPTGTCPSVGVAGLSLGGGIGYLSRPFGLTCDSIKSITLLNADAEVIEVNQSNYPDLFWALRGGGNGSFGAVLGFTFQMHKVPVVTFYELIWEWDFQLIPSIFDAWQSWVQTLPNNITSVLGIRHPQELCAIPEDSPPLVIKVTGLKVGSEPFTEWKTGFKHLKPKVKTFTGSYLEISKYWTIESLLPFNKAKSRILMKPINQKTITKISRFFEKLEEENPDYLVYFDFEVFGGAVQDSQSAFFPRKAFGWWLQAYYWDHPEQTKKILTKSNNFYSEIPDEVSKFCYTNIVDYDLGKGYLPLYYGDHVDRLIKIKKKYDPTNLFHWKQSIPTKKNYSSQPFFSRNSS